MEQIGLAHSSQQSLNSTLEERQQGSDTERYKEVFTAYFAQLHEALPVELVLPKLVSTNVITIDEMAEIMAEATSGEMARGRVGVLLYGHIWKGIIAGCVEVFTKLLDVMRCIDNHRCEELSNEICAKLEINTGGTSCKCNNHR